jgi:hypothetical protein
MDNCSLFVGVPAELVARLDGISDEIPARLLASMTVPSRQECIEELVQDVEVWVDNLRPGAHRDDVEFAAQRIARFLKAIALLSEPIRATAQRPPTHP